MLYLLRPEGQKQIPHWAQQRGQEYNIFYYPVNAMFEMALSEIDAHPDQIAEIKGFNSKYKYRFTVMHKRKL